METIQEFIVAAKSSNANSFGLFQMIVMAKNGEAFKTCASQYNVKEVGEVINCHIKINNKTAQVTKYFKGHELTEKLEPATKKEAAEIWKDSLANKKVKA